MDRQEEALKLLQREDIQKALQDPLARFVFLAVFRLRKFLGLNKRKRLENGEQD